MKNKKILLLFCGILILGAFGISGFFLGKTIEKKQDNIIGELNTVKNPGKETRLIAVVNLDEGTAANGEEKIYYGEKVIRFPNDFFEYTSLEDARGGIGNGKYAAYILIPSSFSGSIESLNKTPQPADIQYALNTNLDGEIQRDVLYNILCFGEELNSDLSYMYLTNILQEFHSAQDSAASVMENDSKDKDAIDQVQAADLVKLVNVPELNQEENTTQPLDVSDYVSKNSSLVNNIDEQYQNNITDSNTQLTGLKEGGQALSEALSDISVNIGAVNLVKDDDGTVVYEEGLNSVNKSLADYNSALSTNKTAVAALSDELEKQRKYIADQLQKSIDSYNSKLIDLKSDLLGDYKTDIGNNIAKLKLVESEDSTGVQIQITCDEKAELGMPPVITINLTQELDETAYKNQQCLNAILSRIVTGESEDMTVDVTLQDNSTEQVIVKKSVRQIMSECDQDGSVFGMLQDAGYANTVDFLADAAAGNLDMNGSKIKMMRDGDLAVLQTYILDSMGLVSMDGYIIPEFKDLVVDEDGNTVTDKDGQDITVSLLLENYKDVIQTGKTGVESISEIDAESLTDTLNDRCIIPLVKRTDDVKDIFNQRYEDEKNQIASYQSQLGTYDPATDTSQIKDYVSQMGTNGTEMQQALTENNKAYSEYASKVYSTTQENVSLLHEHIQEAKSTSDNMVEQGLLNIKQIKENTSQQNQSMMKAFTEKLPYTRLGSMEYTQAYQFIANPIELVQLANKNVKNTEISQVDKVPASNSNEGTDKGINVQVILYILLILMIAVMIVYLVVQRMRLRRKKSSRMGN